MAQDITQEVFLRLFQSLHTYEHRGKLKNFLYRIARNIIIDYFKKTKEIASDDIPCEISDEFEERVIIQAIVNKLDDFERELIILRYYQDLRYSAIAAIVDMPVATVRYNIKRIEKKLKIEMEG